MRLFVQHILFSVVFLLWENNVLLAQSEAQKHLDEGIKAFKSKDYLKSIGDFTGALSIRTNYGEAYLWRAKAKLSLGDEMGFENTEACADLASAIRYGIIDALYLIEQKCLNECYDTKMAFNEPENVYCADFSNKLWTDIPTQSARMINLFRLNLNNNKLKEWPSTIAQLNTLLYLDLSVNKLQQVHADISKMRYLREINLSKNMIKELPYEFGNLEHLKLLNLRSNILEDMPKSIARLKNLETLDLSLNNLKGLPVEIANLKKLKTLHLVGNNISLQQQAIISKLLPQTTIYFE